MKKLILLASLLLVASNVWSVDEYLPYDESANAEIELANAITEPIPLAAPVTAIFISVISLAMQDRINQGWVEFAPSTNRLDHFHSFLWLWQVLRPELQTASHPLSPGQPAMECLH